MPTSTDLHIVSGKGGTGKTSVAAALALKLAGTGCKVLLCEVEGRQGIAQLYELEPLPYEEQLLAVSQAGGEVYALAIDPEAALLEYLQMYYRLGRAGRLLDRFGIIDFATTIAPGVRDVLLTGKVYEAARRRINRKQKLVSPFVYDAIVLDAPPTGRITRFLGVNDDVAGLAKVGPVKSQAESIMEMMRADSTQVHLVTVLEEMPVQETLDGIAELEAAGLNVGSVIVNMVRAPVLSDRTIADLNSERLTESAVAKVLASADLPADAAGTLLQQGREHIERRELEGEQLKILEETGRSLAKLPLVAEGVDPSTLPLLIRALEEMN